MPTLLQRICLTLIIAFAVVRMAPAGEGGYVDVDNGALRALLDKGVTIVDVRRPEEWRSTGVVAGSRLLTAFDAAGRFNPEFPAAFAAMVGRDEDVVLICRTGNRSSVLARALAGSAGYTRVHNVSRGIVGWIGEGNPTVPCATC